jgi:membrane-associated phospholipid phosphatase
MQIGEQRRPAELGSPRASEQASNSAGPRFLEPRRHGPAALVGRRFAGRPVIAFIVAALIGFVILAAVAIVAGWILKTYVLPDHGVGHADEHVNVWLSHHRTAGRNDASFVMSMIGDIPAIPVVVALVALVAAIRRRWRVAAYIVTAITVEAATYRAATLAIHRDRPRVPRLDHLPVDASYYSGHTAASVAVYCGVALLITSAVRNGAARVAVWAVAIAIPLLVALSRMYRGMHHPTDVTAGLLWGVGSILVAVMAARAAAVAEERKAA